LCFFKPFYGVLKVTKAGVSLVRRILLRHDLDKRFGIKGIWKILDIEKRIGVRSTFFIREDVLYNDEALIIAEELSRNGWEIAFHLAQTADFTKASEELRSFEKKFSIKPLGVSPCGSTVGWKGDITWKVMDSLGLKYVCGHGIPPESIKSKVMPDILTFDLFVREYGERSIEKIMNEISKSESESIGILTHPEWFVRSIGSNWGGKWMLRLSKLFLTLIRRNLLDKYYERLLLIMKAKGLEFARYVDLL